MKYKSILIGMLISIYPLIAFASEKNFVQYFNSLQNDNQKGISCYYYAEQMFVTYEPMFILSADNQEKYVELFSMVESMKILLSENNFMKVAEEGYHKSKKIDWTELDEKLSAYCLPKINILLKNLTKPAFIELKKKIIAISNQVNDNRTIAEETCSNKIPQKTPEAISKKLTCIVENVRKNVNNSQGLLN